MKFETLKDHALDETTHASAIKTQDAFLSSQNSLWLAITAVTLLSTLIYSHTTIILR